MNKIRIIDLLNKIASGEEVPKVIEYMGGKFAFTGYNSASKNYNNELEDLFEILDGSALNDEVEIIEEEKKMPEKIIPTSLKGIDNLDGKIEIAHIDTISVIETVNQVIDYLKSKGDE